MSTPTPTPWGPPPPPPMPLTEDPNILAILVAVKAIQSKLADLEREVLALKGKAGA